MNVETLKKAIDLAGKVGHVFVATADDDGLPHVAAAGQIALRERARVALRAWFCPNTTANLDQNRRISLVVWDPAAADGFQLLGDVEKVVDLAVLDGYAPAAETQAPRTMAEPSRSRIRATPRELLVLPPLPRGTGSRWRSSDLP